MIITTFIYGAYIGLLVFNFLLHFQICLRTPSKKHEIAFSVCLISAAAYIILCYLQYLSENTAHYFFLLRIQIIFIIIFHISLVGFINFYTETKLGVFSYIYITIILIFYITRLFLPYTGTYSSITGMTAQTLPWKESINIISGSSSFLSLIFVFIIFLPFPYFFSFPIKEYKKGEKRRALFLFAAFFLLFAAYITDFLIAYTGLNWLYSTELSFVILTVILGYSQTDEVIKLSNLKKDLKKSLLEKNILIQEIHHRVKNNLLTLQSLIILQQRNVSSKETKENLETVKHRINSIALVHKMLYQSKDIDSINFSEFIKSLVNAISYSASSDKQINCIMEFPSLPLPLSKAVPCGLIINELLSNAFKHAFPGDQKGEIHMAMQKVQNRIEIIIHDNGVGIDENINIKEPSSLGLRIVYLLKSQLNADIEICNRKGTYVKFILPE